MKKMEYNIAGSLPELPRFVKESTVLSADEKQMLQQIDRLPTEEEVAAIRHESDIFDLLNAFIGDESSRQTHLQLMAKQAIKERRIARAWQLILL